MANKSDEPTSGNPEELTQEELRVALEEQRRKEREEAEATLSGKSFPASNVALDVAKDLGMTAAWSAAGGPIGAATALGGSALKYGPQALGLVPWGGVASVLGTNPLVSLLSENLASSVAAAPGQKPESRTLTPPTGAPVPNEVPPPSVDKLDLSLERRGGAGGGQLGQMIGELGKIPGQFEAAGQEHLRSTGALEAEATQLEMAQKEREAERLQMAADAVAATDMQIAKETAITETMQEAGRRREAMSTRLEQLKNEMATEKPIDPLGPYSSAGPKALAALGIIFGGLGAALTGGPNRALDLILNVMENDVGRQFKERASKRAGATRELNYMQELIKVSDDEIESKLVLRQDMMWHLQRKLESIDMSGASAEAQEGMQQIMVAAQQKMEENEWALQQRTMEVSAKTLNDRIGAEATRQGLGLEWFKAKALAEKAGKANLPGAKDAKEIRGLDAMKARVEELREMYKGLPTQIVSMATGSIPFVHNKTKAYNDAADNASRFLYRQLMESRMTDKDADWARQYFVGSSTEPRARGMARFEATLDMLEMVKQGNLQGLHDAGFDVRALAEGREFGLDRKKYAAWMERATAAQESE